MSDDMAHKRQVAAGITAGIWLIGIGLLFATRFWWPGILFLVGLTAIFQGWVRGQPWYSINGGFWAIFIGIWAVMRFNMAFLFIGLGAWAILLALLRPAPPFQKPHVDNTLE
jgi:hydrogenase/urease accessory protein HupE